MTNHPAAYQRMFEVIEANRAVFQKNRLHQEQIEDLLSKISTPADRFKSLSILLQSNLTNLSALMDLYQVLDAYISRE